MPYWLQIIASLNPLTYAIESIRLVSLNREWNIQNTLIETIWGHVELKQVLFLFIILSTISFITIKQIIAYKYE